MHRYFLLITACFPSVCSLVCGGEKNVRKSHLKHMDHILVKCPASFSSHIKKSNTHLSPSTMSAEGVGLSLNQYRFSYVKHASGYTERFNRFATAENVLARSQLISGEKAPAKKKRGKWVIKKGKYVTGYMCMDCGHVYPPRISVCPKCGSHRFMKCNVHT